ncbi:MAG TPA: MFS transporter [Afifellaceae bacterium]|nr:MFS transporter [Afifellaceae bacterium]
MGNDRQRRARDRPQAGATVRRPGFLGLAGWCFYDWANSGFPTVITTFVFSVYFTQAVAENPIIGAVQWSRALAISSLIVALTSPVLGAIADHAGRRKPWLLVFTLANAGACAALWYVEPASQHALSGLTLYVLASVAFGFAMVFYDAMLPGIAPAGYVGRLSGWGWAVGYAGGLACLVVALFALVRADPAPFGLDRQAAEHVRVTGPLVALWFLAFSVPLFAFTPDRAAVDIPLRRAVGSGLDTLRTTLRQLPQNRAIARFLLAHMFYTNGLTTLFAFGGVYAAGAFGMEMTEVLTFGIVLNITAGAGAAAFAWVDDWLGSKRTIMIALGALIGLGLALVLVESKALFWVLGATLGVFVGPAQAAGRSLMARLAPPELATEMFGLYALAGKATVFAGPLLLGLATDFFQSQRAGVATILAFLITGLLILRPLREPEGPAPATPM